MKSNKKRKDARFPKWILDALLSIQIKYEWNFTEALLRCTEKGINYYEKQWQKMYGKKKPDDTGSDDRCPNESQEDNTQNEEKEIVTDEELEALFNELYGPKTDDVPKTKTDK